MSDIPEELLADAWTSALLMWPRACSRGMGSDVGWYNGEKKGDADYIMSPDVLQCGNNDEAENVSKV